MASYTSLSSRGLPSFTIRLLAAAFAAWSAGALYTVRFNPELAFCRQGDRVKQAWIKKLERQYPSKIVAIGGSSCATTINAEQMLVQHGLPLVNLGQGAGMGAKVLTRYGLEAVRPGDTLVIALEPGLLTVPLRFEPHGIQFCFAIGRPTLLRDPVWINWPSVLADLRPGSYHLCTLAGKLVLGEQLYRYRPIDWRPGGWQEVTTRRPLEPTPEAPLKLSADGKAWLAYVGDFCRERGAKVTLVLPWVYCPAGRVDAVRAQHLGFLAQVADIIPPLRDARLGIDTVVEDFSDSILHLTPEGATKRTAELAQQIKTWDCWTPRELRAAVQSRN